MKTKTFNPLIYSLLVIFILLSCKVNVPVISSIDPSIGRIGEFITITGSNFGDSRDESYVTIAGIAPTSSSYDLWQDDKIIVRVPELGEAGLVYVHSKGRRSNGMLFSNTANVPRPVDGEELGLQPRITSVNPQAAAIGTLIIINGSNFGVTRENSMRASSMSGVFFSWDFSTGSFNPHIIREPEFIEAAEIEAGYEFWSAREIHVRLPDGAVSGNLEVRTQHGRSRPVFFDVSSRPGYKNFKDKRSYSISYSVDIRVNNATRPNSLYLWIPMPVTSPSQRNVTLISHNTEPFIENHRGVRLYKLDNLGPGVNHSIYLSFLVEVYAVETEIRHQSIRQELSSALSAMHTQSTELVPSDNPAIITQVNSIIGREPNPYLKARAIYDWILKNIEFVETSSDVVNALENRQADIYTSILLFTAMARAARVPCIPLAGVLIDRNGQTLRHYWAEFWIDGFGWLPVDPAMGAGAVTIEEPYNPLSPLQENSASERDLAAFYFGNSDNRRIAFSRGEVILSQMENRGRLVSHTPSYSMQNIWEEAIGGLESYSSLWRDITITGIYQ
ncbi:MAG: IPT/TIG domain-containing protein [Treponema sp.]|jgi:transglutaminase-like putative cysteine protease|nr:IPT/TIG domain-containing protein [Treponema sp.]